MDETLTTWTVEIDADTTALEQQLAQSARLGRQFGNALTTAFEGIALRGRSLGDVLRTLGLSLSRMTLQAAFRPLEQTFGNVLSRLLSGVAFQNGGVVRQGLPVPFASGGVIASPALFPLQAAASDSRESAVRKPSCRWRADLTAASACRRPAHRASASHSTSPRPTPKASAARKRKSPPCSPAPSAKAAAISSERIASSE